LSSPFSCASFNGLRLVKCRDEVIGITTGPLAKDRFTTVDMTGNSYADITASKLAALLMA